MAGNKPVTIYVQGDGASVKSKSPAVKIAKEAPKRS